ncbi:unnamed protein product [Lepidochelys olivacea]
MGTTGTQDLSFQVKRRNRSLHSNNSAKTEQQEPQDTKPDLIHRKPVQDSRLDPNQLERLTNKTSDQLVKARGTKTSNQSPALVQAAMGPFTDADYCLSL